MLLGVVTLGDLPLIDTPLVRTVLVPATAILLGDAFWWPRRNGSTGRRASRTCEPQRALDGPDEASTRDEVAGTAG